MLANPVDFRLDNNLLQVAASAAIGRWGKREGQLSEVLIDLNEVSVDFLYSWLSTWCLSRCNILALRAPLAENLSKVVMPAIRSASDENLPRLIVEQVLHLVNAGATRDRQTSLVSKFAFSLRPEIVVPYDKFGRLGLRSFGYRVLYHDYPAYFNAFHEFAKIFATYMDEQRVVESMQAQWSPIMSENLFRLRTTDKYLMLKGDFPIERMANE